MAMLEDGYGATPILTVFSLCEDCLKDGKEN